MNMRIGPLVDEVHDSVSGCADCYGDDAMTNGEKISIILVVALALALIWGSSHSREILADRARECVVAGGTVIYSSGNFEECVQK